MSDNSAQDRRDDRKSATAAAIPIRKPRAGESIAACIISFNEASNIGDCIDSIAWCDEIIVVDSFSQDRTVEIARERGARVEQQPWPGHVKQKNRAVELATCDWILAIDCDERITPTLRTRIESILQSNSGDEAIQGYYISRKLHYLGRWLEHGGWFPEWRLRLFRRGSGRWKGVDPHDEVIVDGATARIGPRQKDEEDAVILHYSFRDLSHQLEVLDRYSAIQAGELYRAGRRAHRRDLILRPLARFIGSYGLRLGFLDGMAGWHIALNHAYAAYMKYAKLWELQQGLSRLQSKADLVPKNQQKSS